MSLSLSNAPYITVYRNELSIIFNNVVELNNEFNIDSATSFFIIVNLQKLNDDTNIIYKGNITTGIDPSKISEGLNQYNLSIHLNNGVYKINNIQINVDSTVSNLITTPVVLYNVNYHIPSINENLMDII